MYFNFKKKEKSFKSLNRGLTLVELLVVIAIFLVITTVAMFNYGDFNSSVSLQNLTDDIALSIRKAQSFAIGARGVKEDQDVVFTKSYGVHFSVNQDPAGPLAGSYKSFLMFYSSPSSREYVYDPINTTCGDGANQCIELFNIMSIDEVKEIVAYNGETLISSNSSIDASLDIIFTRPDPRAYFCYKENVGSDCITTASRVEIKISNGRTDDDEIEKTKTISVQNTGQISIQ